MCYSVYGIDNTFVLEIIVHTVCLSLKLGIATGFNLWLEAVVN